MRSPRARAHPAHGGAARSQGTEKRVPASMSVGALKALLQRLLKVPASAQRLLYLPPAAAPADAASAVPLDDELRQLSFYGVEQGGRVVVHRTS